MPSRERAFEDNPVPAARVKVSARPARSRFAESIPRTCTLAVLLSAALAAPADQVSHRAQVEEMLERLDLAHHVEATMSELRSAYARRIEGIQLPERYRSVLADYEGKVFALIATALSWTNQKEFYIQAYQLSLDEADVRNVVEFLESDSGVKFVESRRAVNAMVKDYTALRMKHLERQVSLLNEELQARIRTLQQP